MFKYCILAVAFTLLTCLGVTAVSAEESPQIISEVVTVQVTEATEFIFTPAATGYWSFRTSDNEGDPRLWIRNMYGVQIATDDDSGGNLNAHIVVHLVEGVDYIVEAGFFGGGTGSYTLSVNMVDRFVRPTRPMEVIEIPGEGGTVELEWWNDRLSFTPNTTGLWAFDLSYIEFIEITDPFWNNIAWVYFWDSDYHEGVFTVHLVESVEYRLNLQSSWHADYYAITVSLSDVPIPWFPIDVFAEYGFHIDLNANFVQIPGSGGELSVQDTAGFSFVPDYTGAWSFATSGTGSDIILILSDEHVSFFAYGDWWSDNGITMYLSEDARYFIWVLEEAAWDYLPLYSGSFTLTVSPTSVEIGGGATSASSQLPAISPGGGIQEVSWDNFGFSFTPATTGTWTIQAGPYVDHLEISDASHSFWIAANRDGVITVDLAAGVEYFIYAELWWWGDHTCSIFVTQHYVINHFNSDAATTRHVIRESEFNFIPDQTGMWVIRTFANGNSDPLLQLLDIQGNVIAEDDDGSDGLNAIIKMELTAGQVYTIRAGFFAGSTGRYQLSVSRLLFAEQEFPRLESPAVL